MTGSDRACRTLTNTRVGIGVDRGPYFGKLALERRAPAGRPSQGKSAPHVRCWVSALPHLACTFSFSFLVRAKFSSASRFRSKPPTPGMCSGHYPVLAGFWKRQFAVPSRAPQCLSLSTRILQPYPGDFFSVIAVIGCGESRPC